MIEFHLDSVNAPDIAPSFAVSVIGIGGAGTNVIDKLAFDGMAGTEVISMNCDARALATSTAHRKIQLGKTLTLGLGCGGDPELGAEAAGSSGVEIRELLQGRSMVFLCVGLGGGTGSGAGPMVARMAREAGAFVVVFATLPFSFEGRRRTRQADLALLELKKYANALITFENDRMGELLVPKKGVQEAFEAADKIIGQSIRAVTSLVTQPGLIHIGMDDLVTALRNTDSRCLFGFGQAKGESRAVDALALALRSPLLDRGQMAASARNVLVHICGGSSLTLYEIETLMRELGKEISPEAQILFGAAIDSKLNEHLSVTILTSLSRPAPEPEFIPADKRDEPLPETAPPAAPATVQPGAPAGAAVREPAVLAEAVPAPEGLRAETPVAVLTPEAVSASESSAPAAAPPVFQEIVPVGPAPEAVAAVPVSAIPVPVSPALVSAPLVPPVSVAAVAPAPALAVAELPAVKVPAAAVETPAVPVAQVDALPAPTPELTPVSVPVRPVPVVEAPTPASVVTAPAVRPVPVTPEQRPANAAFPEDLFPEVAKGRGHEAHAGEEPQAAAPPVAPAPAPNPVEFPVELAGGPQVAWDITVTAEEALWEEEGDSTSGHDPRSVNAFHPETAYREPEAGDESSYQQEAPAYEETPPAPPEYDYPADLPPAGEGDWEESPLQELHHNGRPEEPAPVEEEPTRVIRIERVPARPPVLTPRPNGNEAAPRRFVLTDIINRDQRQSPPASPGPNSRSERENHGHPAASPVRPTPPAARPAPPVRQFQPDMDRIPAIRPISIGRPSAAPVNPPPSHFQAPVPSHPSPAAPNHYTPVRPQPQPQALPPQPVPVLPPMASAVPQAPVRPVPTQQQTFDERLQPAPNGERFKGAKPTVEGDEDLDVPTFLRRKR